MRPTRAPTRNERLVNDLTLVAIDLQALAQRLANTEGLSVATRAHAFKVAEAGRAACLAAVSVNDGHHTEDLVLHYGQFLTTGARKRSELDPLSEEGMFNRFKPAQLQETGAPVPSPS